MPPPRLPPFCVTSFKTCCFHLDLSLPLCHGPFSSVLQISFDILPLQYAHDAATWHCSSRGNLARVKCSGGWDKSLVQCQSTWVGLTRTL
jgi:hypothetical protein